MRHGGKGHKGKELTVSEVNIMLQVLRLERDSRRRTKREATLEASNPEFPNLCPLVSGRTDYSPKASIFGRSKSPSSPGYRRRSVNRPASFANAQTRLSPAGTICGWLRNTGSSNARDASIHCQPAFSKAVSTSGRTLAINGLK